MEILNSGSFVPLDNREKIDQLIYTARELATEVGRTEGFQSSGQTNHQLGLEMWKGAEYVCRAHEEANIRNIFLSKFLERLREIEKEKVVQAMPALPPVFPAPVQVLASTPVSMPQQPPAPQPRPEQTPLLAGKDEYLGIVPADDDIKNSGPSYADECVPEFDADIEALVDRLDNEDPGTEAVTSPEPIGNESQQSRAITAETDRDDASTNTPETDQESAPSAIPSDEIEPEVAEPVEPESIGPIVLSEKEPYNFDGCTVTAVVHLLPEAEGVRKCVVSVRTHDFTPRVTIIDVAAADALPQISAALGRAFEHYRNELPAMAADKIKEEKPAVKKQSKTASKTAKTAIESKTLASSEATSAAASAANAEATQGQGGLFT